MGFWDFAKEAGKVLAEVAVKTTAAIGHVEQVVDQLKESPRSRWPNIIDAAYEEAESMFGDSLNSWSKAFSDRLSELQREDRRFEGIHLICLGVIARRGLKHL
ncbi:MAG TPA: hypothetical protein VGD66_04340 [Allosphingosinicella sp.]|jgi:hypothetical protein